LQKDCTAAIQESRACAKSIAVLELFKAGMHVIQQMDIVMQLALEALLPC
jgi:hypothetical protein